MGRPATVITLSETEKSELLRRIKLRKGAQDARLRAEIILACAAGESGNDIAQRLGTSKDVVSRWRQRFPKLGLLGLNDEPRSGRPRTISDEQVQQVINQVLQGKPYAIHKPHILKVGRIAILVFAACSSTAARLRSLLLRRLAATVQVRGAATHRALGRWL